MKKILQLTGKRFGRLKVLKFLYINDVSWWLCKCDCGNIKKLRGHNLKSGKVKSCGCLNKELILKRNYKHKMAIRGKVERFYHTWQLMKSRCLNKKNNRYHRYGDRGITVCNEWLNFQNFQSDMHKSYQEHCKKFGIKNTTIDRINNDGNYEPNNCRWATYKEQANNR